MPDVEIKPQKYRDPRPPEHFKPFHARVRAREPEAHVYEIVRIVTVLHALITFRARGIGSENVPIGPVIFAPNHASFMDHFFTGAFVRRRIQFMAKSQLFSSPIPTYIFSHGGVFPVRNWKRLQFPKVTVSCGTPLHFAPIASPTREQRQEAADLGLDRIRAQHGELVRRGHRGSRRAERPHAMA
jgi:1-acyl-sn-glycerol-3-phosphate acyltransferase